MATDRSYLIGVARSAAIGRTGVGRHRDPYHRTAGQRVPGRHRAGRERPAPPPSIPTAVAAPRPRPVPTTRPNPAPRPMAGRRPPHRGRALPAGLATLLTILASASAISGWFAASGASVVVGMIAR
jgi:hypothetical protein